MTMFLELEKFNPASLMVQIQQHMVVVMALNTDSPSHVFMMRPEHAVRVQGSKSRPQPGNGIHIVLQVRRPLHHTAPMPSVARLTSSLALPGASLEKPDISVSATTSLHLPVHLPTSPRISSSCAGWRRIAYPVVPASKRVSPSRTSSCAPGSISWCVHHDHVPG